MLTISLNYSINHTTDEMQRGTVGEQDLIEVDHIAEKSKIASQKQRIQEGGQYSRKPTECLDDLTA